MALYEDSKYKPQKPVMFGVDLNDNVVKEEEISHIQSKSKKKPPKEKKQR